MNKKETVVVKFKDGQIMIFSYTKPLKEFLASLESYTGDSKIDSYLATPNSEGDAVLEYLKSETKFIIKYCPKYKNKGYKVMIGKFWKLPEPSVLSKIEDKVSTVIRNKDLNIFNKKPNFDKNVFELKIFNAESP